MNNSDMPAMPVTDSNGPFMQPAGPSVGLSKREHFAAMAMQGFLSNRIEVPSTKFIAKCSIDYADALLKALENDDEHN